MRRHEHLITLLALILLAFLLRVLPLYDTVFTSSGTVLLGNDPYYHIRLAENLAANFPLPLTRDAFIGNTLPYFPLMSYLIVIPAHMLGCSLETWAAWVSPLAFIALLVVVYLLGKTLLNKWAGVLAVAIVAFLPTELFNRSLLGFADHHVLEVLFVSMMFLYLLSAYKTDRLRKYGLLGGVALALYVLCWKGFPLYLLIFTVVSVLLILLGKSKGRIICNFHLISGLVGTLAFIPLLVYFRLPPVYIWAMLMFTLAPYLITWLKEIAGTRFTVASLLIIAIGTALAFKSYIMWTLYPATGVGETISEATPAGTYILIVMGIAIAPYLIGLWRSRDNPLYLTAALWSLAAVFMFAIQMRWSYYLSVPFALVATVGVYELVTRMKQQVRLGVATALIFFILLPGVASTSRFTQAEILYTPALREAMAFLGRETPEPFGSPDKYLELYGSEPDYEVMSWWPNGFFIIYGAHRVPVTDPTQRDADIAARFFVYGTGDFEYVLVDSTMIDTFPGMVQTLGGTWEEGKTVYRFSFLRRLLDGEIDKYEKVFDNKEVQIWQQR